MLYIPTAVGIKKKTKTTAAFRNADGAYKTTPPQKEADTKECTMYGSMKTWNKAQNQAQLLGGVSSQETEFS